MFGFKCCKQLVLYPQYDTEGYAFGEEGDDACIVPKDCKTCVATPPVTTTFTPTEMTTMVPQEWSATAVTPTMTA
jgi:hypothetical protein